MNEKLIEKKLRMEVKKLNGIAIKLAAVFFTGLPDRLVLLPGAKIFFAELKSTGKKLKPRQMIVKKLLESLGFHVAVIDDEKTLFEFLDLIKK